MLHVLNNKNYTDFRAAYKQVLIQAIYQKQNVTKLNINWLFG